MHGTHHSKIALAMEVALAIRVNTGRWHNVPMVVAQARRPATLRIAHRIETQEIMK